MRGSVLLSLLSCLAATCSAVVDYSGHQVFRTRVTTAEQAEFLVELRHDYDFWTEVGVGRYIRLVDIKYCYLYLIQGQ